MMSKSSDNDYVDSSSDEAAGSSSTSSSDSFSFYSESDSAEKGRPQPQKRKRKRRGNGKVEKQEKKQKEAEDDGASDFRDYPARECRYEPFTPPPHRLPGPKIDAGKNAGEIFMSFVKNGLPILMQETNRKGHLLASDPDNKFVWTDVTELELCDFIALHFVTGLVTKADIKYVEKFSGYVVL